MRRPILFTLFVSCFLTGRVATAHFIWLESVSSKTGATTIQVYFGEEAAPDDPDLLDRVAGLKLQRVIGKAEPVPLKLTRSADSLSAAVAEPVGQSLFIASHDLGVLERGESKFRLKYYAKTGPSISSEVWQQTETADELRLDVVPTLSGQRVRVVVRFDGRPVAGAEVKAAGPGIDEFSGSTDAAGMVTFEAGDPGLYSIRARHIEAQAGELDGQTYPETRHYSTVAVHVPGDRSAVAYRNVATLNQPVTSFGAAVSGAFLYVYGGHTGAAHSYSHAEQGRSLWRLNVESGEWNRLADGPPLQGLAMVAHEGLLYRIGGFTAKNEEGADHDLWSQSEVARFDPASGLWTEMPSLPEPRSSFDAAVLGDAIYVIGGWSMQGKADSDWHDTAWKLDLSQSSPQWEALPAPPFRRRALAVAAFDGKLYAIGGMQSEGGPTRRVDVFDAATGQWSRGPEILGDDGMTGFGASAFASGGRLYVSTIRGTLQRLSDDGRSWEMVGETPTPRFFHRMLALNDSQLLVVGGASMQEGKFDAVEILSTRP